MNFTAFCLNFCLNDGVQLKPVCSTICITPTALRCMRTTYLRHSSSTLRDCLRASSLCMNCSLRKSHVFIYKSCRVCRMTLDLLGLGEPCVTYDIEKSRIDSRLSRLKFPMEKVWWGESVGARAKAIELAKKDPNVKTRTRKQFMVVLSRSYQFRQRTQSGAFQTAQSALHLLSTRFS